MFDPTLPQAGTEIDAVQMRGQLNGLKDLIDAIQSIGSATVDGVTTLPSGSAANASVSVVGDTLHFSFEIPQGGDGLNGSNGSDGAQGPPGNDGSPGEPRPMGETGPQGQPFAQAVVDGVNTLDPWENATVAVNFDGSNVHFTFGIPRGNDGSNGVDGAQGPPGSDGSEGAQGPPGNEGAQGPPFAQAVVDGVTTLEPGENATVEVAFDGSQVHFSYGIPRGNDGNDGAPGEVSFQQLADAIATTSSNSNGVDTLGLAVSDPPTQAEVQQIADKLDELINALRR